MSTPRRMEEINLQPKKHSKAELARLGRETSAQHNWQSFAAKLRRERHAYYTERMGELPETVINVWRDKR